MTTRLSDLRKARDAATAVQGWLLNPKGADRYEGVCAAVRHLGFVHAGDIEGLGCAAAFQNALLSCIVTVSERWAKDHNTALAYPIPDPEVHSATAPRHMKYRGRQAYHDCSKAYKWSPNSEYGGLRLVFAKEVAGEIQKLIDHYSRTIEMLQAKERTREENKNGKA